MGSNKTLLAALLEEAAPLPFEVASPECGSLLALAAHCVMMNEGFSQTDNHRKASPGGAPSPLKPPAGWNSPPEHWDKSQIHEAEAQGYARLWTFNYHYSGAATFRLSCGLAHGSGKLYIEASQDGKADNLQALALAIPHYVAPFRLKDKFADWGSVILEQDRLYNMLLEHICRPLLIFSNHPRIIRMHLTRCSSPAGASGRPPRALGASRDDTRAAVEPMVNINKPILTRRASEPIRSRGDADRRVSELEELLNRAPPNMVMTAVLASAAAATTAVVWAWRK